MVAICSCLEYSVPYGLADVGGKYNLIDSTTEHMISLKTDFKFKS